MCVDSAMPASGLQGADIVTLGGWMHERMRLQASYFLDSMRFFEAVIVTKYIYSNNLLFSFEVLVLYLNLQCRTFLSPFWQ